MLNPDLLRNTCDTHHDFASDTPTTNFRRSQGHNLDRYIALPQHNLRGSLRLLAGLCSLIIERMVVPFALSLDLQLKFDKLCGDDLVL